MRPGDKLTLSGDVPLNLPHGWAYEKLFGEKLKKRAELSASKGPSANSAAFNEKGIILPSGATPFFVHLAVGTGFLTMALLVFLAVSRRRKSA